MKILLLSDRIPPEGRGGAEAVVWRLAQGLAAAGHETHVAASTPGAPFEELRDGIPTYHLHAQYPERFRAWLSLWNPQTSGALRSLLQRLRPDIVNAHNIHSFLSYHSLKLARAAGCGVVFSAHDAMPLVYGKLPATFGGRGLQRPADYLLPAGYNLRQNRFRYNPWRNMIIRRHLQRHTHSRTVPSRALAAAFADNDLPPAEVVHNGIDLDAWGPPDETIVAELRGRLGLEGKRVILIAGRLTEEKGMRQALLALDRLRESLNSVRLLVLTSREAGAQLPADLGHLRPYVTIGGWLSGVELRAAYQLADVVAVPSIYIDPFPTVNLEAMAAGKPVVATCFGGSPEVVLDGETGFIVDPLQVEALAGALLRLLRDDALRASMGERGRERIRAHFDLTRQVERMLEIYQRALQSR
ncbi:MAG: glycosyltransferase family 4 protein [Anaerolineae bacterium]|nr:glycosyltransferase family 4 protein [Anaerolineae bacterium]